jgi:NADPH:quinone reductase-like Zn-dependent oxidoreductase
MDTTGTTQPTGTTPDTTLATVPPDQAPGRSPHAAATPAPSRGRGPLMRAATYTRYGDPDVVTVTTVPRPRPRRGEVLVRVHAAAVTSADGRIRSARFPPGFTIPARLMFGVRRPRRPILGSAFSGVVTELGDGVDALAVGDRVCGMTGMRLGAHAEYLAVKATRAARVPDVISHDDAAGLLFGGTTALHFLRDKATIGRGTTVLVNGASGAIGTNAVQLAALAGGTVTAVTRAANADLAIGLGAEDIIDHTHQDLATLDRRFDVVLDVVGNLSIESGRRLLAPGGKLLLVVAGLGTTLRARGDVVAGTSLERVADFEHLLQLVEHGRLRVVLEHAVGLDDITEAHRLVDSGRKRGNIVVRP